MLKAKRTFLPLIVLRHNNLTYIFLIMLNRCLVKPDKNFNMYSSIVNIVRQRKCEVYLRVVTNNADKQRNNKTYSRMKGNADRLKIMFVMY